MHGSSHILADSPQFGQMRIQKVYKHVVRCACQCGVCAFDFVDSVVGSQ